MSGKVKISPRGVAVVPPLRAGEATLLLIADTGNSRLKAAALLPGAGGGVSLREGSPGSTRTLHSPALAGCFSLQERGRTLEVAGHLQPHHVEDRGIPVALPKSCDCLGHSLLSLA